MTKHVFFFDRLGTDHVNDNPPAGMTRRGAASSSPSNYSATVGYGTPPFKRRQVTLSFNATSVNPAFSFDAVDSDANRATVEVCVAVYRPSANELTGAHVIVRGQGSGTVTDAYEFAIEFSSNRVRVYKVASSVRTNPFSDLTIAHAAGTWMLYTFSVSGGATTELKAKTWAVGADEPAAWGLEVSDSSSPVTAAGWVGFGGYAASGTRSAILNFFTVGTGGDTAPRPRLNVDFAAWLKNMGEFVVTARMKATGYDSAGSPYTKEIEAFASFGGFTSKPWDTPANQHFPPIITRLPTFSREMPLALRGEATIGIGSMVVANPAQAVATVLAPEFRVEFEDLGAGVANTVPSLGTGSATMARTGATATTVLSSGLVSGTIAADTLRYYYDPVSLNGWGAIFEEERTNLIQYSESINVASGAPWILDQATASADVTTAPDGATTADKLVESTANSQHVLAQAFTAAGSTVYASSIFTKAVERTAVLRYIRDVFNSGTTYGSSTVNLSTGAITAGVGQTKQFGSSWWRLITTGTPTAGTRYLVERMLNGAGAATYVGDGSSGMYQWGGQIEAGGYATTYIPRLTGSTATRAKDLLSYPVSGNLATNDVVIVFDWRPMAAAMGTVYLGGSYVDASNYTRVFHDGTNIVFRKRVAGVNYDATIALAYTAETKYQIACRLSSTAGVDVFVNGVKGTGNADTTAAQLGTSWQHMADGNGVVAGAMCSTFLALYGSALNDGQIYNLALGTAPQSGYAVRGVRDDWWRVKWRRDYITLTLGQPTDPLHDHRVILLGRLGQPVSSGANEMSFPISDLAEQFNAPIQTATYSSGAFINRYKPLLFGAPLYVEMPQYDAGNLKYQVHDGALDSSVTIPLVYDNGPSAIFAQGLTVSAVDTGTETITTSTNHGALVGWRVVFQSSPPAPFVINTEYWVSAVPAANQLRLTLVKGGATENITGSTTGGTLNVYGYDVDRTTGVITLNNNPAGRVFAKSGAYTTPRLFGGAFASGLSEPYRLANMYERIVLNEFGMSEDFLDATSVSTLRSATTTTYAGLWLNTDRHTVKDVLARMAAGSNTWWGFTLDGLFQIGQLNLPAASAVKTITQSQVEKDSLQLKQRILPIDFTDTDVTYKQRNFVAGFMPTADGEYLVDRDYLPKATYGSPSTPIDTAPQGDTQPKQQFDLIFVDETSAVAEQTRLKTFYAKAIGVFEFRTTLAALFTDNGVPLNIGDTIELTFPLQGWKTWSSSDPSSPDNTTTIDSTKAVVLGFDIDLSRIGPFKVGMTVFRQIPGYYPEENLN